MTVRHPGMEYWLSECRVQLLVEAVTRGITPEERAEGNLHRDAINRRLSARDAADERRRQSRCQAPPQQGAPYPSRPARGAGAAPDHPRMPPGAARPHAGRARPYLALSGAPGMISFFRTLCSVLLPVLIGAALGHLWLYLAPPA